MATLYDMRDSPYNPPNWIHMQELPQDFVTVQGGFEVKTSLVHAVAGATHIGLATAVETESRLVGYAPYFVDNFQTSYSNSAPFREQIMIGAVREAPQLLSREYQVLAERSAQAGDALVKAGSQTLDWDAWKASVDKLAIV